MHIVVIGTNEQASECRQKFGEAHDWHVFDSVSAAHLVITDADVVFDFGSPVDTEQLHYPSTFDGVLFLDMSFVSLSELLNSAKMSRTLTIGFCGLPTLLSRDILEVSHLPGADVKRLAEICRELDTSFEVVKDQPGLVSARIICMIINEAFFTLEDDTATREDIDLAMKLGTNYPYGPFEWADRIGLKNVVQVLQAAGRDSGDKRYDVCPLLMRQANS